MIAFQYFLRKLDSEGSSGESQAWYRPRCSRSDRRWVQMKEGGSELPSGSSYNSAAPKATVDRDRNNGIGKYFS